MIVKTRQKWYLWHCLARLKKKLGLLDTSLHVVRMASDCHLYPEIRCVISLLDVISILHRVSLVIVRMDQEWIKNGRGKRFRQMEKPLQRLQWPYTPLHVEKKSIGMMIMRELNKITWIGDARARARVIERSIPTCCGRKPACCISHHFSFFRKSSLKDQSHSARLGLFRHQYFRRRGALQSLDRVTALPDDDADHGVRDLSHRSRSTIWKHQSVRELIRLADLIAVAN